jgi:glutamate carboxypeptidase
MERLTTFERDCVERAAATPMLGQVETWALINSGSRNLDGPEANGERTGR